MIIHENVETVFKDLFQKLKKRCNKSDIEIKIPRINKRQKHRCNIPMENAEDYYRVNLFIPFIDSIVQQLNDRFNSHKQIIDGF